MKMEEDKNGGEKFQQRGDSDDYEEPRSMSMREAVARSKGNDDEVLTALNEDAAESSYGALFEHTKVSTG